MLEDQVAYLLQRYLGNYVRGLNKEALKISVWKGDVELTNMQLKPEALSALKLPVKVKAGFLGSVKLKVPWSRLGQDPVLVSLDRIFLLAEPATQVEGCSEDTVQEVKKSQIREMEMKLLESTQLFKSEMNKSWLGSLIDTIIGNLRLSISNIHIRYEDNESNPGHPFSAGVTLERLSAVTVDDNGKETFVTGGALERIQKSIELKSLAVYLDSDISPWTIDKPWERLLPMEWSQVFMFGTKDGKPAGSPIGRHTYVLQPVTGSAKYSKLRPNESLNSGQPLQKAAVNLDDVTLCLSKNGYRDLLKLADNFAAFNRRVKHAHFRPFGSVKSNPRAWWKYAYKAVSEELKKASGKLPWEQVLKYARLRKRYIPLYVSLLKSDLSKPVVDDNKEIEELDRELDDELILQWRMLAHKFVEQSVESDLHTRERPKKSWWSFGWNSQPDKDESDPGGFGAEDWEQLNKIIGYKEGDDGKFLASHDRGDVLHTAVEVHMRHNASKLTDDDECLAELSCDNLDCFVKLYPEAKVFDVKLGSYQLSSPNGLLAESATASDSLVGVFCYKPFNVKLDWSMVAKASPCYVTYLKDSVNRIINFFQSNTVVSRAVALETAAAVQMTIDEVKRTAQEQVNRALKEQARFLLDLDIAAPKVTIPTDFSPDNHHSTKLLLDFGNLIVRSQDDSESSSADDDMNLYLQFDVILSDVSAFLVDGDYSWSQTFWNSSADSNKFKVVSFLPVIDNCGVILKLQQIRSENPLYPSTRLAVRLPSLGFHFSPARYHRLMQVAKIFQVEDSENADLIQPWHQADFEGWLLVLTWKGVGNREAVWQRRYLCLVGPFLYVLESPDSKSYKQCISLRGKQLYLVPPEIVGNVEHVLALCDLLKSTNKVVEDGNALILRCDFEDSKKTWQNRVQGAIYRASASAAIAALSETSSDTEDSGAKLVENRDVMDVSYMEKVFVTGVLDELKICFNYNSLHEQSITNVLLAEEGRLFEFRAIGGQVELSIRANDIFIGTVLKSLEIEDLVCRKGGSPPCYLARSFIRSTDATSGNSCFFDSSDVEKCEGDDKFYEASENLNDSVESPMRNISEYLSSRSSLLEKSLLRPPSFSRVTGLLPNDSLRSSSDGVESADTLDSFVKAQVIIYDQSSLLYHNIDKRVAVTLATLSFFCRRPTILAILEFVNAINVQDGSCESFSDNSSGPIPQHDLSGEQGVDNSLSTSAVDEHIVKGLLGMGKSRIIFYLTLNMVRAEILLMYENECKLATLSQDNLLTDIKVFPSSFSIKAALGNLRISDDSLPCDHMYFWVCDMRNPGGSSFVELVFSSFSADDEDYEGYDYSLFGQLSEVRIVYLNRFIQEVASYFMGLVPGNSKDVVKIKDQVTNSEKWFTTSEFEGSPALKMDLSLRKPIILMPRRTDSLDYLQLDVVHITVQNTFQWLCGSKRDMNGVHVEVLTVRVEDINLNVGTGTDIGESIIQDVKGIGVIIQRSLRDLLHQIPSMEIAIKIEKLKAALSNREYQIITECALSNVSETPNIVPPPSHDSGKSPIEKGEPFVNQDSGAVDSEAQNRMTGTAMKVSIDINLVELCLLHGIARDSSLATLQISGAWLLYKSNMINEGFLSASLKDFSVIDDREGTEQALRLAVGKPRTYGYCHSQYLTDDEDRHMARTDELDNVEAKLVPTMLILDAKFGQYSTFVSLCVQRPQLLVALDFLLAVAEFFVPSVRGMLSNEEDDSSPHILDAVILDEPIYSQASAEFSVSPQRPLVVDGERFDHFVYDGRGGTLYLRDRQGVTLSSPSSEAIIYVGNGKRLQFRNVFIKNGQYLDSCIFLGTDSSYSASENDKVSLEGGDEGPHLNSSGQIDAGIASQNTTARSSTELIIELQAIGPELTFYSTSKDARESQLSNKLLHAQLDAFCRLVSKGDTVEVNANALGLTMESNGIRILEPFDTSIKFLNASGQMNIHFSVSDIFMNFSFSILRLFLAVEEDILSFLRMTSKKMTLVCSEFDKVGTIENPYGEQVLAFWRPHAPPGFAVLGDYLTPLDKPPTKGVLAVNTSLARVKRPVSFKLVWPPTANGDISEVQDVNNQGICSIWFPEAPKGYVALGCVVSTGRRQPPLSSAFCISASLVTPCPLRDCIAISSNTFSSSLAFWRVDSSIGTFLPADPSTLSVIGGAYELRHILFQFPETSSTAKSSYHEASTSEHAQDFQSERASIVHSGRRFEAVASFRLVWWNQGSSPRKKLSIWHPIVPPGMVYFGDIAVQGYEPPNTCIVLHDSEGDDFFKRPLDFLLVGQIKKQRRIENISFWLPQAPPGFVALGCVACKGTPKQSDFSSLRCLRSDMVTGGQFQEESIWDTSDVRFMKEPFSIWIVDNELGTFVVRSGFKKPPRRFAVKLADRNTPSGPDNTVVDAEIGTFSAALFDDYGGMMVPLFNISVSGIGLSLHGRSEYLNSAISFSLAARSYNDKYEAWEPLVEPVDGFLRYQYDCNAPGATSQLRLTCTRDLNLNVSVSNANMIFQAYASWNNLSQVDKSYRERSEAVSPTHSGRPFLDVHHRRNYYIVPQNKLGQDIFIRATEVRGLPNILKMPSGDTKLLKVPVWKNMLESHLRGNLCEKLRSMVTIIIAEAELLRGGGLSDHQFTVAVRLSLDQSLPVGSLLSQQSARTCGASSHIGDSDLELVKWNEMFFFRVDSPLIKQECYVVELIVTDMGKGEPVGYFSASLNQIARTYDRLGGFTWVDLSPAESMEKSEGDKCQKLCGRIRCSVLLPPANEVEDNELSFPGGRKQGFIQISPTREGPWTTVRLNYAAPAACWRLGNDVVASEVSIKDGNRYVNIRSLVSVRNNTDFTLDVCLKLKNSVSDGNMRPLEGASKSEQIRMDVNSILTDEFFETEKYDPTLGWISCMAKSELDRSDSVHSHQDTFGNELPSGWQWVDDWHIDKASVNTSDGWIYAPDLENLKWPESYDPIKFVSYARQRRWIRNRKQISGDVKQQIFVGQLEPGEAIPLPLPALTHSLLYILQLRPLDSNGFHEYAWSSVIDWPGKAENSGIYVSALTETEELLYCSEMSAASSNSSHGMWFYLDIQATEIAKDIHSGPIHDWNLVVKSPLSITNYLPLAAEFSVLEMQDSGHFLVCSRGIFCPGRTVKVYSADIRKPLYFSLLPQRGWLPVHEAVLISHPSRNPVKTISLRCSTSGRVVPIILEQNQNEPNSPLEKIIRVYSSYWFSIARCPPLTLRLIDMIARKQTRKIVLPFQSIEKNEVILEEITEEEIYEGYTIASALNFKMLALSVSISQSGGERFGPAKDLSPLGDMDGSLDVCAYNADGNCMQLFISSKPSPYQSVPTKVISVRPFVTFTNRIGQDMFIKFSSEDEPKILHAFDSRVSFVYREASGPTKLQVRLENTKWSFPLQIMKEDTIYLVLWKHEGARRILRMEIRGYEEGSRFIVVFRPGSTNGPIRLENRTANKTISVRQSGFSDDSWVQLKPLSTTNFSWEDPYGQRLIDAKIDSGNGTVVCNLELDKTGSYSIDDGGLGLCFHIETGHIKVARFTDDRPGSSSNEAGRLLASVGNSTTSQVKSKTQENPAPLELIVELGVVGISVVDHRPKELSYLYLERFFISYSTGYDGGTTSRFKLVLGYLQLDNQLPLTPMPVLLVPEQTIDMHHPVFKMTITICNENPDGVQVYPYVYIRVTDKCWRLSIYEPIIWACVDFYNNLQLDRLPQNSSITQVDPEIRIDLIDVSEVRLKVSLETAPAQRPHGVLGVWSPILSAVGNAFKIQVHLRRVMHRDRFMRKSSVIPAISNRVWRDLIHNPLHLIFSIDVLGMTSSTLASLSKGFAELSTDGQFLQLRSKQVSSRRITGVGDGFIQGTEALAQGVAFGVSGVLTKPMESARQNGILGLAHGLGRAFLGIIVQPVSGALDFFSLTVDGIGASCSRCLEVLNSKTTFQRIRSPRVFRADHILREYNEREAVGQMVLYLAEASRNFGCTEIFKEPSKFAWSDYYEDHFIVPYQRIVLITNKRVMLLQCLAPDKMDKKPCKIMWDVPWEELMTVELAKAGCTVPSHLILHLKKFKRSEAFVRVIKCSVENESEEREVQSVRCSVENESEEREVQSVRICSTVHKMWKAYQSHLKSLTLRVPSSQRFVCFAWSGADKGDFSTQNKTRVNSRKLSSSSSLSDKRRFVKHSINFIKVWSSEQETRGRCTLCRKQAAEGGQTCSIWRPVCPDGYVSVGDIARVGTHPPNVAAVYRNIKELFVLPVGYDLVWRNCPDDYVNPISIWHPRAPDGFFSPGCIAVPNFEEPDSDLVYCVAESIAEGTVFEDQKIWSAPDSYPWACHIYQVKSDALHFVALRLPREESGWRPMRVLDEPEPTVQQSEYS